jgi:uncharacterized membrane protein/uncharacterized membrane protein YeaQ/YmgE (transglycosylase-associated protein family)
MRILAWIVSGIVAGWLTGYAFKRQGYGLLGNLLIGSTGGLVGGWALESVFGITVSGGWPSHILVAMIGGVALVGGVRVLDQAARHARLLPATGARHDAGVADLDSAVRKLGEIEKRVLTSVLRRTTVAKDPIAEFEQQSTFGQRVADQVAAFGGSWTFIGLFLLVMAIWMAVNARTAKPFDPFPFILLNLVLSCLAALQAPVIMMSQNRQAERDRVDAKNDYQVNLNAEMQILALHTKFDEMRERQLLEIVDLQRRQIEILEGMVGRRGTGGDGEGRGGTG